MVRFPLQAMRASINRGKGGGVNLFCSDKTLYCFDYFVFIKCLNALTRFNEKNCKRLPSFYSQYASSQITVSITHIIVHIRCGLQQCPYCRLLKKVNGF